MTTQKYLCPPRLQKKFLLWWWTVPELILIATLVVATFYLTSLELMALTLFIAIGAARVDFEHNLFGALRTRTLYQLFTKTFTANEKLTAKEEKRQRKRLTKQMRSRLPIQDLIQFRFADNGIYGGKDGKELFRFYRYDLYVTARLPGCENWNGESGATEQTVAQWEELCSPSYTGESEVMEQYLQELQAATLNDDWEGWSEVNIEWTKVLYQTDWEDLYGVTVTQVGITNTDSFTPSEDYTGGITGSGNGTFIIPLASYSYISCHFGEPDGWTGAPHGGMDFAAGYGTPIYAAADGVVVKAGYHNSWGNYVKIYHGVVDGNQIYTLYAHCSSLGVSAGQTVTQGQTIAAVGSTGDSTGNHLHFEVYVNNTRVAPENWL